ncbi:MAG: hypothetical protein A2107_08750 [Verrucomicrobia bacterium GWF2_62_7]|nr:MAG: hypothetical protein A2107_08750 [Verrucomicrobia bacterium GWF2_62_7]
MSNMEQVRQNVASAAASAVGSLSPRELALVGDLRQVLEAMRRIPCTHPAPSPPALPLSPFPCYATSPQLI